MNKPIVSDYYKSKIPSAIRLAQLEFDKRTDHVEEINLAIGNVCLPTHPAMQKRMFNLGAEGSPFADGAIQYTSTPGTKEANDAFLNVIASSGFDTSNLHTQVTDGGSLAMVLLLLGVCGPAGSGEDPVLLIDAAYTNYTASADRVGRSTISVSRHLQDDGTFTLPDIAEIEAKIIAEKPKSMVVIPYDNPTGQFFDQKTLNMLAELCVKHNLWMISDEAYRELFYIGGKTSSIWGITNNEVAGIEGRRISIETSSKVWNSCGLRIGAIVTDNYELHEKAIIEGTTSLCAGIIGQYIFGALANESHEDLNKWYQKQRDYYAPMMKSFAKDMKEAIPDIIISSPDAAIYSVIDVRNIVEEGFDVNDFVLHCAQEGSANIDGKDLTLLLAPMTGFYTIHNSDPNPGKTQLRVAYVETPEVMKMVPKLFKELFEAYVASRYKKAA